MLRDKIIEAIEELKPVIDKAGAEFANLIKTADVIVEHASATTSPKVGESSEENLRADRIYNTVDIQQNLRYLLGNIQHIQMVLDDVKKIAAGTETL